LISGTISEKGAAVSKTKLLKLLYLCEVEFFRVYKQRLTPLDWKFYHLGPWARSYDDLLTGLVANQHLIETTVEGLDYDTTLYRVLIPQQKLRDLFSSAKEAFTVEHVLNRWVKAPTPELLNHVYFHTEPMLEAHRGEQLNFNTIQPESVKKFELQPSGLSRKDIQRARKKFQAKIDRQLPPKERFRFTAPKYDEQFQEAMAKLDELDN
jgi:predicted ribosome quality control (RQC) complex YloA/Tae2 family protein